MSLWPGYYFGAMDAQRPPITEEIPIVRLDTKMEPLSETKSTAGTFYLFGKTGSTMSANAFVMLEQFGPGSSITWMYPNDEFHYIIMGKARVTYSLYSTGNSEKKTMDVEEGDFLVTPRGSIVEFKILPGKPLRRIAGVMPGTALNPVQAASHAKEAKK